MNLSEDIIKGLKAKFNFRKTRGDWMQEGTCPQCGKKELYCAAKEPKMVKCGRVDRCGFEDSVRNLLPDLFEDWSKRAPATEEDPDATADAYLIHERGLDPRYVRGTYSQEYYRDSKTNQTAATVRFPIADTYWERIIDRPGRFDRKAHFGFKGSWRGHCWMPKGVTFETLAKATRIWITEGIFDAVALTQAGLTAVSNMSTGPFPEHFLSQLNAQLQTDKRSERPELVFAFDVGNAGVTFSKKHVKRAKREGWDATAAQVRPDGEGTKLDWNDLWLRHRDWKGDPDAAPLADEAIATFLHNGAITLAENPYEKAELIVDWAQKQARAMSSFDMRHDNRLFWVKVSHSEEEGRKIDLTEICNCAFRLLYRERDEALDETTYFVRIDFPDNTPTAKARFSSASIANNGEFKKRLMAFAGSWTGEPSQLDRIIKKQTRGLKVVEPIPFTGYSQDHEAWLLGDIAIHQGRLTKLNSENYFDVGKRAVKLRSNERLLDVEFDPDRIAFGWLPDIWTAYGARGLIALAFFTMSVFAVQIREKHKSLGFVEITGPPGSGKTTLIEFLWKLLGRAGYEGFDPNKGTVSFLSRSLVKVSGLPVGLVEGKRDDTGPTKYKRFDYDDLLVLYNGRSPRGIGKKTGGFETEEPPFLGSIYLMQNERIDADAPVLQRLMSMAIDKSGWSPATREAAMRLESWPIEEVSGTLAHIALNEANWLPFFFERYMHHDGLAKRGAMEQRVEGLTEARPIKCHSQLAAALETLPKLFKNCEERWIDEAISEVDRMALDRQQSAGGDHPTVSDFWEKVEFLLSREGDDQHDNGLSLNRHRKPEQYFAINLPMFEQRCRQNNIIPPRIEDLKRLLRGSKSRKFIKTTTVNPPAPHGEVSKVQACWLFEQPKSDRGPVL